MKGFIYLLEIAIAAILMVAVLSTFFAIRVKQSWESSDLIDAGNNMLNYIRQDDSSFVKILDENFTEIENLKLANIGYGLTVKGSPKSNIIVGCTAFQECLYVDRLLTDAYLNGRWINFEVQEFNIDQGVPNFLDAIVLVNYTGYSIPEIKSNILNYLNLGGVVIGINATYSDNQDFKDIFGLQNLGTSTSGDNYFVSYDPSAEDIEKYFLGIGFNLTTNWYIWEEEWTVSYGSDYVNISRGAIERSFLGEGDVFDLPYLGGGSYSFKVKEIWPSDLKANVQALDTGFVFKDFEESLDFEGNQNVVSLPGGQAEMTSNGSAIWMSDFPYSSEYEALVKAAIISRNDEWIARGVYTTKETTTVSSFFSLCCDMPETTELEITLWYIV
jgi:hypothetical protein